ncbi:MAG: hypothetical protein BMS9Abin36_1484 [Gammaproteobacteria bacterium]|nr:MAG: hypothetical protein BMS9Abin36_1484 [Gammaproteobacteria bacterium]
MKAKIKMLILGLIIGAVVAFPLGINFGRGDSLFSNPFANRDIQSRVKEAVKEQADRALEGTKDVIHDATKPMRKGG